MHLISKLIASALRSMKKNALKEERKIYHMYCGVTIIAKDRQEAVKKFNEILLNNAR